MSPTYYVKNIYIIIFCLIVIIITVTTVIILITSGGSQFDKAMLIAQDNKHLTPPAPRFKQIVSKQLTSSQLFQRVRAKCGQVKPVARIAPHECSSGTPVSFCATQHEKVISG
jgi:hypothetical protein